MRPVAGISGWGPQVWKVGSKRHRVSATDFYTPNLVAVRKPETAGEASSSLGFSQQVEPALVVVDDEPPAGVHASPFVFAGTSSAVDGVAQP